MAIKILKNIIFFSTTKQKPIPNSSPCSYFSTSSPPSDQSENPLVSTAVSLLTHHRSKSRWTHLASLYPSGLTPSQFSQIALTIKNNPHLALRFFSFTQRKSLCKHDLNSYATMIHILSRARITGQAQDIIRVAIRSAETDQNHVGKKPILKLFEILVKTYRLCGSAPFVFDLLIKCCLEVKKINGSVEIVRILMSRGVSVKVSTFNALIMEVSRAKGVIFGYELYTEIFGSLDGEKTGGNDGNSKRVITVRPNVHTFNNLMVCFYREGLFEKVEDMWIEMKSLGCEPNSYSYSVLIAMYCDEGRMDEAEMLWKEMRENDIEQDIVAYNTMIGGFCKIGEVSRAEEYFKEMGLSGIESSCTTFEHLVNGYCRVGDVDSAKLVYEDMQRRDLGPEGATMEFLVGGFCEKRRVFEALKIFRDGDKRFGLCATKKSYVLLIKGLCDEGETKEALKVQAEMVGKGFEPDLEIYEAFIGGYMKIGNEEMATMLNKEMIEVENRLKDS